MTTKIYTITLSPTIDYILKFNNFELNKTNRALGYDMYAAGKGIHVSMMLKNLNHQNEAIVFTDGNFEEYFYNDLKKSGLNFKRFKSNGEIRINLKLIDQFQTEGNLPSPIIELNEINKLKLYLQENLQKGDCVVITGSSPKNLGSKIYLELAHIVKNKEAEVIIDSYGSLLTNALSTKPFLIKPNLEELELTVNKKLTTKTDIIQAANKLIDLGAINVLVSYAENGALLINQNKVYSCSIPKTNLNLVNAAGSGDSMLAGFIHKYQETNDYSESLKFAVLTGSATAYSERIADITLINYLEKFIDTMKLEVEENG